MRAIIVLGLLAIVLLEVSARSNIHHEFHGYVKQFNKNYASVEEYKTRLGNYQANMQEAARLNLQNPKARFGPTKFSDLSKEEFAHLYLTARVPAMTEMPEAKNFSVPQKPHDMFASGRLGAPDPTNFDWGSTGVITPVYNQGQCGSCWAFSATETIESYFVIGGGQLTQLSMEQIVDCDTAGQDQGCGGGFPTGAYQYVQSAGGIDSYANYPYSAGNGQAGSCQFNAQQVVTNVANYNSISGEGGEYSQLSSNSGGPVSVCVAASSWQNYQGGVLTSCDNNVDHCVQLTGYYNYGSDNAYWNVRNSWGADWGQSGYIWLAIGQDLCSIGDYATIVQTSN
jgi:C1A family cysteine protease